MLMGIQIFDRIIHVWKKTNQSQNMTEQLQQLKIHVPYDLVQSWVLKYANFSVSPFSSNMLQLDHPKSDQSDVSLEPLEMWNCKNNA